jgi:micrococcal nuclease
MNKTLRYALAGLLLLHSLHTSAEVLYGRVVSVADGDSLTILDASKQQYKIRLVAIDAPERSQAFGSKARQALSRICFGKEAEVTVITIDRYQRYVAEVFCAGVNANETMLSEGMAWAYRRYSKRFPNYLRLEQQAKNAQLGLWLEANPTPPWKFRRER